MFLFSSLLTLAFTLTNTFNSFLVHRRYIDFLYCFLQWDLLLPLSTVLIQKSETSPFRLTIMSVPDTHLCSGCDNTFTLRGYHSHLSQTQDPLCRAVFDRLKKSYETYQQLEQVASNSSDEAVQENQNPDLVLDDDETAEDSESDSELEDSIGNIQVVAERETGWEQPREGAPQEDAGRADSDMRSDMETSSLDERKSDADDFDTSQLEHYFDRYIIGDGYGVKPAVRLLYTDKYPTSLAGEPLSHEESRDHVYGLSLGGGDNPWAPFRSKKDWEIARWAKLRGVGSTAFSDMLAIDGVSFSESQSSFY